MKIYLRRDTPYKEYYTLPNRAALLEFVEDLNARSGGALLESLCAQKAPSKWTIDDLLKTLPYCEYTRITPEEAHALGLDE